MVEFINGVKFINGYLCDDSGRPITMTNGYSSEDEKDAHEIYMDYKKENSRNYDRDESTEMQD